MIESVATMALKVEISPYLTRHMPDLYVGRAFELEYRDGLNVRQLILELGIRVEEVGVVTVNRSVVLMDDPVKDGDSVGVFPSALGG